MWNFHGNVQRTYGRKTSVGRAEVTCVDVDWANNRMVSGDRASRLQIWRLDKSEAQHTLQNDDKSGVHCLSVSWNQGRALCGAGNLLQMWDINSVQAAPEIQPDSLLRLSGHEGPVVALLVDWGEQIAMSASADKTLRRWDLQAGVLLQTFSDNVTEITCMSGISPGLRLVAGDTEGQLKEWDTKSGMCTCTLSGHTDHITTLSSMHKDYVVSGSRDGTIRVWTVRDSRCLSTMQISEVASGQWVIGVEAVAQETLLSPTFRTIDASQSH
jgi:WD40 repeat protein